MTNEWQDLPGLQAVAKAQAEGWEIERYNHDDDIWISWNGNGWLSTMAFRGRPHQPAMKKVKLLCWFDGEDLFWKPEDHPVVNWQRFPAGDIEGEVEE